ncbi:biotin-lipoyl like family protein [Bordetella holmesii 70147]|nr:biotin-lipoyl like family protein [Bordetella holmesii 70147]
MAITDVVVPQLSESVSEATLLTWKKQPGAAVEADEILIEIETDKVVLEVPAPSSGVLAEIVKGDGSTVTSGELIARIDTAAKAAAAPAAAAAARPRRRQPLRRPGPGAGSQHLGCRRGFAGRRQDPRRKGRGCRQRVRQRSRWPCDQGRCPDRQRRPCQEGGRSCGAAHVVARWPS